ncbi:gamma-parvin isoform X1 [Fukomys damarensis]|uniref:gamma-parvin isoform X1 n=1 Tax=Fukomys damarensis TaxID=885580 RepID=UPI0014552950|nr:gamma-parvin isoform X1 [Fukomys damarensis]
MKNPSPGQGRDSPEATRGDSREKMEPDPLYNLLQLPKNVAPSRKEEELLQGEKKKYLPAHARKDPKFVELQRVLMEWVNATLLPEHIVVRSLEEDMFDGLILHHLFHGEMGLREASDMSKYHSEESREKLAGLKLEAEEIALNAASQRRKLEVVLGAVDQSLRAVAPLNRWSVDAIFSKDLLATLHLLVALARHFQPDLALPPDVRVEVVTIESTKSGLKSEKSVELLTDSRTDKDQAPKDIFDELFKLAPEKVGSMKEAIVSFVNQKLERLGLSVQDLDTQFADGVILLLLIGQLGGFFLHLKEFYLTPSSPAEMLHNVTLALDLLKDEGLLRQPVSPEDIVNKDSKSTLRVLYSLFCKHKLKANEDGMPRGAPN